MTIRVALHHKTQYRYDRHIALGPQIVRLRPAPHCRTPICSYSLNIEPKTHFCNWQQDPQGNYLARLVFPEKTQLFSIEVDVVADMTVINPFDFFLESYADKFPFQYEAWLSKELKPFLETLPVGQRLGEFISSIPRTERPTVDFLVDVNQRLQNHIKYLIRLEPGVQTPEETLTLCSGSCRDSAWLLVQILRNMGLAARFTSGYLIQLAPDVKSLDGPSGPEADFTDLHAWAEVYLPGAGWVGLDPTSGLFAGEGHIPLACTPDPQSAAPISGGLENNTECKFEFEMKVTRIHEDPRVTRPYTDEQWREIEQLGHLIDARITAADMRLTMGGEPTFVSIDNMEGAEWNTAAVGEEKRALSIALLKKLRDRYAPGGLLHFGQGKWYPGESLPRWALGVYWRNDGKPIWRNPEFYADEAKDYGFGTAEAELFTKTFAEVMDVDAQWIVPAFEDTHYYLWKEHRLPMNVKASDPRLKNEEDRARMARILDREGLSGPVGFVMPLRRQWWQAGPRWKSGPWPIRPEKMFLLPGDSPIGLRLPLDSLPYVTAKEMPGFYEVDPLEDRPPLPDPEEFPTQAFVRGYGEATSIKGITEQRIAPQRRRKPELHLAEEEERTREAQAEAVRQVRRKKVPAGNGMGNGDEIEVAEDFIPAPQDVVRTALCVEPRGGRLYVFLPPVEMLEDYLEIIAAVETTAEQLDMPVMLEGYLPPFDYRLSHIKVTPDPGVIEVNVHPARSWDELVSTTTALYDDARTVRLATEKFDLDGKHTGTGGGNHIVIGGPTPADSPFLRRPDLLRSLVGYWNNHPGLSYLFSGRFIGPTSQAPRVDEGRRDAIYELQIAFAQVPPRGEFCPPWLVDRIFRNLLVDLTGNTHRAEFCIDKLFSPDSSTGRLGLVEFRGFEMPPHARMSLTQQLLIRALLAWFWDKPYQSPLIEWGTALHDRFMLPHFIQQDFNDVTADLAHEGLNLDLRWFAPHFEFRFPLIGELALNDIHVEVRQAIEPWYVLGEEPGGGGTVRFVDSSVERLQVKVRGIPGTRYAITCNGRKIPLTPTGSVGEFVAGVRYRAWQPSACLHPTIPVHTPLVLDILDTWQGRSIGGCTYHVSHPGGRNYATFPVNAYEAEARRAARFFKMGHTPGPMSIPADEPNPNFPLTLDLRRDPPW